jgi:hypothetical protein
MYLRPPVESCNAILPPKSLTQKKEKESENI